MYYKYSYFKYLYKNLYSYLHLNFSYCCGFNKGDTNKTVPEYT